jgi:HAE1 family hydrophobic/amphiphilic exporter-1
MLLVSGTSGEFFALLPKAVIVTLVGSLIEALVILPAHYLDWGSRLHPPAVDGAEPWSRRVRSRVDGLVARARDRYLAALEGVLGHRVAFLGMCVAALAFAIALTPHLDVDLFRSDFNQMFISMDAPVDAGIDQTSEAMAALDAALGKLDGEIVDTMSYVGMKMTPDNAPRDGVNYGVVYVQLPDTPENVAHPERMLERIKGEVEAVAAARPDVAGVFAFAPRNGPPVGSPVAVRIQADDYDLAKRVASELKAELATIPGVYNIEDNMPLGPRELRVELDEHRASLQGLTFQDIGVALRAANDGLVPSTFKDPEADEDLDIRVMLPEAQRRSIADLLDVEVRTPTGHTTKLGDVANIQVARGYQSLYHYDAQRALIVYAKVDGEQATSVSVNSELAARFADASNRWPGVSLIFGGEFQETERSMSELLGTLVFALIAIYAILAAQFRSYLQPLVVMSVIGFGYIGVVLGMFVLGYPLTMYVFYAMIGLAGIVVNDSLVLIDFVNQERTGGLEIGEAVGRACRLRFRPIVLTTLTTIAGLLPMALGIGGTHPVYGPFAAAIVFGLAVASGLTLFTVPALYLALDSFEGRVRGALGRAAA